MTDAKAILCVGRLYCDLIFTGLPRLPTMGTEVYAAGTGLHAGGGAYITAAHLSALGNRAALCATLPVPPFRDIVVRDLENAGVDAHLCTDSDPTEDPQITVALAGRSDRAFVTRRVGPAFPPLSVQHIHDLGARHIHIGELATLTGRPELIDLARRAGVTLSLDCGWDEDLDITRIGDLISDVDVFLPNEAEMEMLTRAGVHRSVAPLTVIKQGKSGALAIRGTERIHEGAKVVEAIDTTGAGDAFNAGFLSSWLSGHDLRNCLRSGHRRGHLAVSQRGGFRAPPQPPGPGAQDADKADAGQERQIGTARAPSSNH
ncbi:carbohydrate kinase family protein [Primorskyibacter sp. 2E107]|uniref:carbohydrate kinase family protein n=1 Tax=Primorskyibacter sp. 2E107 TaxID=3403458 RepID=UPI003AF4ED78